MVGFGLAGQPGETAGLALAGWADDAVKRYLIAAGADDLHAGIAGGRDRDLYFLYVFEVFWFYRYDPAIFFPRSDGILKIFGGKIKAGLARVHGGDVCAAEEGE